MILNCFKKHHSEDSDSEYSSNSEERIDNKCENSPCLSALELNQLKQENWHKRRDDVFFQVAYERKIIRRKSCSIGELSKEDKKHLEAVLAMCNLEDYHIV